ncbi:NADH dehydrogenase [ubiquinone] 1 alpha subcomplex subunit 10, mitochondrial-like [Varroa jacobsoni]|uniref:NADH dehydrogenase [ubiquinone] 1 alpha subcomplex subunit 10, mitochondrial-like n=1 Tax=Varroa jacobsoni TaxID=62625 RepID=UPI000BF4E93D|nr:NADH dehydrogenase [ubiquinone] 1 alpha subcomplex subunit 10, mitochondrial-like [Varroa jacobsoni]
MALSILRVGLQGRMTSQSIRLLPAIVMTERRAGITHKSLRKPKDIKPFPYETKKYGVIQGFLDDTAKRLDENSRIIVVEGSICSGKSTLAKTIAEEFDFLHFPEVNMDMQFIDDTGFDVRSLQHVFPDILRPFDEKLFYERPDSKMVANFRNELLFIRIEQYCDAMAHLLNTGQGIVLERSPFSDYVIVKALYKCGYITENDVKAHGDCCIHAFPYIYRPHLVIYLDVPVDILQKRIKNRGIDYEVNSKIRWLDYLKSIKDLYEEYYLPSIREQSEVLIYDWSEFGDYKAVIEDIERIDFEKAMNDSHSLKFSDWKEKNSRDWMEIRYLVTTDKLSVVNKAYTTLRFNTPDLIADSEEIEAFILAKNKYFPTWAPGWDPKNGIRYLWKNHKISYREALKYAYRTR